MSSIHREGDKPNWFCHYYDPEGFRRKRSTGTTNSKVARVICATVERASKLAADNKLSNEKGMKLARETCDDIQERHGKIIADNAYTVLEAFIKDFVKIAGGELTTYTISKWLNTWLEGRTDASKATLLEYRRVVDLFLKHLGTRADRALATLHPRQVEEFKQLLIKRVSPSTVNKAIKVLKASFTNAVAKRQLEFNPAQHIESIQVEEGTRRPFTLKELKDLLKAAKDDKEEWKTMILIAYYTGLRLRDCANLTWQNVELHKGILSVSTEKTGRRQVLPIADPLSKHLQTLAGDNPNAPLSPALHGKKASWLSARFYDLMVDAGLLTERGHKSTGKGRSGKRDASRISFHSLRYNTTSALKSEGVSDAVAMDIVGHETASVSQNYTKIDEASKRAAIDKLPDITKFQ